MTTGRTGETRADALVRTCPEDYMAPGGDEEEGIRSGRVSRGSGRRMAAPPQSLVGGERGRRPAATMLHHNNDDDDDDEEEEEQREKPRLGPKQSSP
uniref:Uncharacterized protein n=1 Tax=Oryza brachyantha TaxID=4533 RepID=J3LQT1_ORYBR